jgi:hypothetical protein
MSTQWVVLFDNEGVDTLVPWGELAQEQMLATLSGEKPPSSPNHIVSRMMLRARFNQHRHPEVWGYNTEEDIAYDDMRDLWEDNPQYMADLVRSKGEQFFGDKPGTKRKQVIV